MSVAGIAVVGFLIVSILASISTRRYRRAAIDRFQYRSRKQLMTGAKRHCYQILNEVFGQKFYIIPDVELSALLSHKVGRQNREEAYQLIGGKTVDFVFCNQHTIRPVCVVKLEDDSKRNTAPGASPTDMQRFFKTARLPFVYIKNPAHLDRKTIIEEFSRVIYETSKS